MSNKNDNIMKSIGKEIKDPNNLKNNSLTSPYSKRNTNSSTIATVTNIIENMTQRLVRKRALSYFLKLL